jgi:hypothetical protein
MGGGLCAIDSACCCHLGARSRSCVMQEPFRSRDGGGAAVEACTHVALNRLSAAFRHNSLLLQCRGISLRRTLAANRRQANRTWWLLSVRVAALDLRKSQH